MLTSVSGKANAAANRNRGAEHSSGNYISFIDADDAMLPNRLKRVVEIMQEHKADACLHTYLPTNKPFYTAAALYNLVQQTHTTLGLGEVHRGHITVTRAVFDKFRQDESAACVRRADGAKTASMLNA